MFIPFQQAFRMAWDVLLAVVLLVPDMSSVCPAT
jgi:hypothetical protein